MKTITGSFEKETNRQTNKHTSSICYILSCAQDPWVCRTFCATVPVMDWWVPKLRESKAMKAMKATKAQKPMKASKPMETMKSAKATKQDQAHTHTHLSV